MNFLLTLALTTAMQSAQPRTDQNSIAAHQRLLTKAKAGKIDLYFLGDSILRRWGCADPSYAPYLANWNKNFHGWNAGDFGWGGDSTGNVLWRIQNGELDGVNPKVIVILAGTNDIGGQTANPGLADAVVGRMKAILDTCQAKAPDATIILTAIFPRNDDPKANEVIQKVNHGYANLTDGHKVRFLTVNSKLADAEGNLHPGMMNTDHLHPALPGYQVWADALEPLLENFLGPKSDIDQAPPPTLNPALEKHSDPPSLSSQR